MSQRPEGLPRAQGDGRAAGRLPIAPCAFQSGSRIRQARDIVICYSGGLEQLNIGACLTGVRLCTAAGTGFDATCIGETLPTTETCSSLDDDCDGIVEEKCAACGDGFSDPGEDSANCSADCRL